MFFSGGGEVGCAGASTSVRCLHDSIARHLERERRLLELGGVRAPGNFDAVCESILRIFLSFFCECGFGSDRQFFFFFFGCLGVIGVECL